MEIAPPTSGITSDVAQPAVPPTTSRQVIDQTPGSAAAQRGAAARPARCGALRDRVQLDSWIRSIVVILVRERLSAKPLGGWNERVTKMMLPDYWLTRPSVSFDDRAEIAFGELLKTNLTSGGCPTIQFT